MHKALQSLQTNKSVQSCMLTEMCMHVHGTGCVTLHGQQQAHKNSDQNPGIYSLGLNRCKGCNQSTQQSCPACQPRYGPHP